MFLWRKIYFVDSGDDFETPSGIQTVDSAHASDKPSKCDLDKSMPCATFR